MSKYFLGSVGKAEAFRRGDDGKLTLAFVSKTLTDSGLNISTTKDDIRAGEGAPIQFSFYHDSSVEVTLTDVLWKKEYLEAQLGARFMNDGHGSDYITRTVAAQDGQLFLDAADSVLWRSSWQQYSNVLRMDFGWGDATKPTPSTPNITTMVWKVSQQLAGGSTNTGTFVYSDQYHGAPRYRGTLGDVACFIYWNDTDDDDELPDPAGAHMWELTSETQTYQFPAGTYALEAVMPCSGAPMQKMPVPCADGDAYIAWYTPAGQDEWRAYSADAPINEIPVTAADGISFCVRYLALDSRAKVAEITSSIIPEELFLVITAPIFAGDACAASRGKAAGHITFEIPRFQLNGAQEFAMNMSSNQTIALSGVALASAAEDCDTSAGKLLRIIEVVGSAGGAAEIVGLTFDDECLVRGGSPVAFAVHADGTITPLAVTQLVERHYLPPYGYLELSATYTWTTGPHEMNINDGSGYGLLSADVTVTIN